MLTGLVVFVPLEPDPVDFLLSRKVFNEQTKRFMLAVGRRLISN